MQDFVLSLHKEHEYSGHIYCISAKVINEEFIADLKMQGTQKLWKHVFLKQKSRTTFCKNNFNCFIKQGCVCKAFKRALICSHLICKWGHFFLKSCFFKWSYNECVFWPFETFWKRALILKSLSHYKCLSKAVRISFCLLLWRKHAIIYWILKNLRILF